MSQAIMAQKQKTLAKAGEANPDIFTVSRTETTGYTHGHKPATGFLMESRMQGNSHVRFGESCDPFSRNLVSTKGMRGKGRRGL